MQKITVSESESIRRLQPAQCTFQDTYRLQRIIWSIRCKEGKFQNVKKRQIIYSPTILNFQCAVWCVVVVMVCYIYIFNSILISVFVLCHLIRSGMHRHCEEMQELNGLRVDVNTINMNRIRIEIWHDPKTFSRKNISPLRPSAVVGLLLLPLPLSQPFLAAAIQCSRIE